MFAEEFEYSLPALAVNEEEDEIDPNLVDDEDELDSEDDVADVDDEDDLDEDEEESADEVL